MCVFGHIHECHGLEEREWAGRAPGADATLFVNAASVDVSCTPVHTPIVVDVPRPRPARAAAC